MDIGSGVVSRHNLGHLGRHRWAVDCSARIVSSPETSLLNKEMQMPFRTVHLMAIIGVWLTAKVHGFKMGLKVSLGL